MNSHKIPTPSTSLFAGVSAEIAADITKDSPRVKFRKDAQVALSDIGENCLYLIVRGSVRVVKDAQSKVKKSEPPRVLKAGDFTGELQLFVQKPAQPDLHALENGELIQVSRTSLVNILYFHPVVLANLVRHLTLLNTPESVFSELLVNLLKEVRLAGLYLIAGKIDHEIKSPLTVITLTAQLIEGLYPDSLEFTNSIQTQVHLLEDMVQESLNLIRGNPIDLNIQKVDLGDFLDDIKDSYGSSLESRKIKLRVENKCFQPVYFDAGRIRRVIISLLRNSSEAMTTAGEISIVASVAANWLLVSLSDNGPGIPASIVPQLFEPFVNYGKEKGLGLGLPICAKLVEEHSGVLEYQPVQPNGSRFDIRLPLNAH